MIEQLVGSPLIRWGGLTYILVGGERDGAIATKEQFEHVRPSTAYLFKDGVIRQHGKQVGTIDDIEYVGIYPEDY